jgi:hypothetical protein
MNERIKELQIQAEAAADEIFDRQGKMYGEIVMEKFAELIIAECISALDEKIYSSIDGDGDEIWADLILKEHFGVEE